MAKKEPTEAKKIAFYLRELMNLHKWTASDVMRGMVVILNGTLITKTEKVGIEIKECVA